MTQILDPTHLSISSIEVISEEHFDTNDWINYQEEEVATPL
jgi:hypothetical protein